MIRKVVRKPPVRPKWYEQVNWSLLILPAIALFLLVHFWPEGTKRQPPGMLVATAPVQENKRGKPFDHDGYILRPMADLSISGRVLARLQHRPSEMGGRAVPLNLVLGWQNLSDSRVVADINFSFSGRYLNWNASRLLVSPEEVNRSIANLNIVPATPEIEAALLALKIGQVVELSGKLVNLDGPEMFSLATSLSRDDVGISSAEVLFVEKFHIP